MLVSHAHSFRQQARLAVTLAWVAGYTNILTFLACGTVTSHMTGITSLLGRDIFSGTWGAAGFAVFILTCFFMGAGASGFCTEIGRNRNWESIFVLPIIIEASLLGVFALLLYALGPPANQAAPLEFVMVGLASAAMGLQNATITQISRGQVRTTHVTGVLSDLGQEFVQFCLRTAAYQRHRVRVDSSEKVHTEREQPARRRLLLLASILCIFAFGAGLGTWMYAWQSRYGMFPPVLFLIWIIYQDITTPIAEIQPSSMGVLKTDLPSTLAVFHLRRDNHQSNRALRIPNLLAWSERLSPETRVVILDVAEIADFNTNALLELKTVVERFSGTGRTLIVSGLNAAQAERLMSGTTDKSLLGFICPDLELAIARGINSLDPVP